MELQGGLEEPEGKEDQWTLKALGGAPLALLPLPGHHGLPSGSSLASLELHQTTLTTGLQPRARWRCILLGCLKGIEAGFTKTTVPGVSTVGLVNSDGGTQDNVSNGLIISF